MPPRKNKAAEQPSWTTAAFKNASNTFPMIGDSFNKLQDMFDGPSGQDKVAAPEPQRAPSGAPKKRKRTDDAGTDALTSKRTSLPGATAGSTNTNGTGPAPPAFSAGSVASGRGSDHDISSTAAAALTAHLTNENLPGTGGAAAAAMASADEEDESHDNDGSPEGVDGNISGILGDETAEDYNLHGGMLPGGAAPDGEQQPYLTWEGKISNRRAEDGTIVTVPQGHVMGPHGFPVRPNVGSPLWHRFRKDNHKEVERRRRETINEGINELAKIVPGCEKNKGSILARAVQYIHDLKARDAQGDQHRSIEHSILAQAVDQQKAALEQQKQTVDAMRRDLERVTAERDALRAQVGGGGKKSKKQGGRSRAESEDSSP